MTEQSNSSPSSQKSPIRLIVIGDYCIDEYVYCSVDRLNPEAPTPVAKIKYIDRLPGMVGNVVANLVKMSGKDGLGVDVELVIFSTHEVLRPTLKTRYVDEKSGYILLRADKYDFVSDDDKFDFNDLKSFAFDQIKVDMILVSDYNKGYLSTKNLDEISSFAKIKGIPTIIDTKKNFLEFKASDYTFVKINEKEFEENRRVIDSETPVQSLCNNLIVTKGSNGATYYAAYDDVKVDIPTIKIQVSDVCGAGDVFLSAFALEYSRSGLIGKSILEANIASAFSVTKRGVTVVEKQELDEFKLLKQKEIQEIENHVNSEFGESAFLYG